MGAKSSDEDALAIIEELNKRIEALEKFKVEQEWLTNEIAQGQGKDRQNIAELRVYFDSKDWKRNNFEVLAVQLLEKLLNRKKGMDYKDIMKTFNFGSRAEAYRLMNKTVKKFPLDVRIKIIKSGNRKKRLITRIGGLG